MDPNANIKEQRELATAIIKEWDNCNDNGTLKEGQAERIAEHANRLAELVQALDEWQRRGGYSPYTKTA